MRGTRGGGGGGGEAGIEGGMAVDESSEPRELCEYFELFEKEGQGALLPAGIYTLDDLKAAPRPTPPQS